MNLLLDVHVSTVVRDQLRAMGFAVQRVGDVLDPRASDVSIVAEARRLGAVLVSRDQDFSAIVALSGEGGPSLLNLRVSTVDAKGVAHVIASVLTTCAGELQAGCIVSVDDGGARIRPLPVARR